MKAIIDGKEYTLMSGKRDHCGWDHWTCYNDNNIPVMRISIPANLTVGRTIVTSGMTIQLVER